MTPDLTPPTSTEAPPPGPPAAALLTPGPLPPRRGLPRIFFGLVQPLLGLRVLLTTGELRRIARTPILFLVMICSLVAYGTEGDVVARAETFLATMVALAPLPVVLFGKTYRRLASAARVPLGLSPRSASHPSLASAIGDAIRQSILIGIGVIPVVIFVQILQEMFAGGAPLFVALAWAIGALWALHWIVVEAVDNGQTLAAGTTPAAEVQAIEAAPDPWFVAMYRIGPLKAFARVLRRLSRPWRRELAMIARHPDLALGFGLGIAAMLAVPLVALVFRPAAVIGAVHLLGRIDEADGGPSTHETSPST